MNSFGMNSKTFGDVSKARMEYLYYFGLKVMRFKRKSHDQTGQKKTERVEL
jgi:hypothetical protein